MGQRFLDPADARDDCSSAGEMVGGMFEVWVLLPWTERGVNWYADNYSTGSAR